MPLLTCEKEYQNIQTLREVDVCVRLWLENHLKSLMTFFVYKWAEKKNVFPQNTTAGDLPEFLPSVIGED